MGRVWPESGEEIGVGSKGLTKRRKNGPPGRGPPIITTYVFSLQKKALFQRLREVWPNAEWIDGYTFYLKDRVKNLVPGTTAELYEDEYRLGAGGELDWTTRKGSPCPPKMNAAHSSSALVVNSFAAWKLHLDELELFRPHTLDSLHFESKVPTGLGGIPPHLDFLAESTDKAVLAVESKLTEYLQAHPAGFVPAYGARSWPLGVAAYAEVMRELQEDPERFVHLDAAQLVKHAFGLASLEGKRDIRLLYLFWEPRNQHAYPEFKLHRQEAERFSASVAGASVKFCWKSYSELWEEWELTGREWLQLHARELLRRYAVDI